MLYWGLSLTALLMAVGIGCCLYVIHLFDKVMPGQLRAYEQQLMGSPRDATLRESYERRLQSFQMVSLIRPYLKFGVIVLSLALLGVVGNLLALVMK